MFFSRMKCWILRKTNGNFVKKQDGNFTLINVVVFKLVLYPKKLSIVACSDKYFASAMDNTIQIFFLQIHLTKFPPMK